MFASGVFIALGLAFIWFKLDWKWRLWMNSNPVKLDLIIFTALTALHWGTYTGVMAATIGALTCSAMLSLARWGVGYYGKDKKFVRGKFNMKGLPV